MAKKLATGILSFVLLACALVANAKPIILKCRTELGPYTSLLVIDLAARTIKWGGNYTIYFETPALIAAYEDQSKYSLGNGEVLVLDLKTGAFKEAGIVTFFQVDHTKIVTYTHHGRCNVPRL